MFAATFVPMSASAGFINLTDPAPDSTWPQSSASVFATYRNVGDSASLPSLSFPYVGSQSASVGVAARVFETYSFSSEALQLNQTTFDRGPGPSSVQSSGAWVFGVTETMATVTAGRLTVSNSGYTNGIGLVVVFDDLTDGTRLFESSRGQATPTANLVLGDVGADPTFAGSLVNTLFPGHTYRMLYTFSVGNYEAAADSSIGSGELSLMRAPIAVVPEPTSALCFAAGLAFLMLRSSRARRQDAR
jgi:hypothetical protein